MRPSVAAALGGLAWGAIVESTGPGGFVFGAFLGWILGRAWFPAESSPPGSRLRRGRAVARLGGRFLGEVLVANVQQLRLILAPTLVVRPCWLTYRTQLQSPRLRAVLSLLISLTPGSVTADLLPDHLIVHVLDTGDPEAVEHRIRSRFESLLLELER